MDNALPVEAAVAAPVSFAELRKDRFFSVQAELKKDIEYVEQLALQTSTCIDSWDVMGLLDGVKKGDKRAINKRFFAHQDTMKKSPVVISEATAQILESTDAMLEATKKAQLKDLRDKRSYHEGQAVSMSTRVRDNISLAWTISKELLVLENRPHNYVSEELKKLLTEGFWVFEGFKAPLLTLQTSNDIIMTEQNQAAGINRVVNLGKYRAVLDMKTMNLTLQRYLQNIVTTRNFYHPYVSREGEICWGTAADTATKKLTQGHIYDTLTLLSALLSTYSDGMPWEKLGAFEVDQANRIDAKKSEPREAWCEYHDEARFECECGEWCGACDQHVDHCTCYCCEICEETFPDNDRCNCCHDCGNISEDCERCRECDQHDGHARDCSERSRE